MHEQSRRRCHRTRRSQGKLNFRVRGEDPETDVENAGKSKDKFEERRKVEIEKLSELDVYREIVKPDYFKGRKNSGKDGRQKIRTISLVDEDDQERRSEADSMPEESERTLTEDEIATADYMINHGIDSPSEMSSEELEIWIRALEPCEVCQLRTPFRCRRCLAIVCQTCFA